VRFEWFGMSVVDFRCRASVEPEGPEEPNPTHSIVFVRRGVFQRRRRRDAVVADANFVLFFNAGEPYRYAHPVAGGDDCTILTVETARALELVGRHGPADGGNPEAPFRIGHAVCGPKVARLHYELLHQLGRGRGLAVEEVLLELTDEAVRACYTDDLRAHQRASSAGAARRRRELVEAVKLAINEHIDAPPSLKRLAEDCGCSPFHLSRTFRETTGKTMRAYTRQLRSRVAADRLARGARDLTTLALDLGYADHSHFTNTFRREWGVPPSAFRARLGPDCIQSRD
jgi:AraC-like DNA-binding protein